MKSGKCLLTAMALLMLLLVPSAHVSGQETGDDAGWGDMVFTVHNVDWYYKVEEKAIKLKWDRQYVRRRGDPLVFEDLTISYAYSFGPAAGDSHNWITGTIVLKGWDQKNNVNGEPPDPRHTVTVTLPVDGGTKGIGAAKKFCWKIISGKFAKGSEWTLGPEEQYKVCTPAEADDQG